MVNGRKIRELRELEGLTAVEFGQKVYASQTMISHIESGVKQPSVNLLKRIADYFRITVNDLLEKESAQKLPRRGEPMSKKNHAFRI